jgi:hypothetical protein
VQELAVLVMRGGTMNREWHRQHKMPERATEKERIEWHLEHAKNCTCRPAPKELLAKMEKQSEGNSE